MLNTFFCKRVVILKIYSIAMEAKSYNAEVKNVRLTIGSTILQQHIAILWIYCNSFKRSFKYEDDCQTWLFKNLLSAKYIKTYINGNFRTQPGGLQLGPDLFDIFTLVLLSWFGVMTPSSVWDQPCQHPAQMGHPSMEHTKTQETIYFILKNEIMISKSPLLFSS